MKLHGNARTCPRSRCLAVGRVEQEGWTLARAAEAAGVSVRTLSKWLRRFRDEGKPGLHDRSSAPSVIPHRTPEERVVAEDQIRPFRRVRKCGRHSLSFLSVPRLVKARVCLCIALATQLTPRTGSPYNEDDRVFAHAAVEKRNTQTLEGATRNLQHEPPEV